MNKINNRYLVIALIVLVVFFLYFGSGAMMDNGGSGMMNQNGWMGGHSWRWYPTIVTLLFGVLIGWLLFKKKN